MPSRNLETVSACDLYIALIRWKGVSQPLLLSDWWTVTAAKFCRRGSLSYALSSLDDVLRPYRCEDIILLVFFFPLLDKACKRLLRSFIERCADTLPALLWPLAVGCGVTEDGFFGSSNFETGPRGKYATLLLLKGLFSNHRSQSVSLYLPDLRIL